MKVRPESGVTRIDQLPDDVAMVRLKCSIDYLTMDAIFSTFPRKAVIIGSELINFVLLYNQQE